MERPMRLSELAFACYIYGRISDYDSSYHDFLKAANHAPDLRLESHRIELLKWLNKWGCRQFAKEYHRLASDQIAAWYEQFNSQLISKDKTLLNLSDDNINSTSTTFDELAKQTASKRANKSSRCKTLVPEP